MSSPSWSPRIGQRSCGSPAAACCAPPKRSARPAARNASRPPPNTRASPAAPPVPASSGQHIRYRLERGGNRQLNAVLHRIAITQIRWHAPARDYYQRKLAEGKTTKEALRCLKRQIATTIWKLLQPDPENTRSRRRHTPKTIICNTPLP